MWVSAWKWKYIRFDGVYLHGRFTSTIIVAYFLLNSCEQRRQQVDYKGLSKTQIHY